MVSSNIIKKRWPEPEAKGALTPRERVRRHATAYASRLCGTGSQAESRLIPRMSLIDTLAPYGYRHASG